MLNAEAARGTADWYLLRLGQQLTKELPRLRALSEYDCGNHPLPVGNRKLRETYRRFQQMSRTNYTGLIAESVRERCRPLGFVSGTEGDSIPDSSSDGSAPAKPAPKPKLPKQPKPLTSAGPSVGQKLDETAWDIWQANYLDSGCATVHHQALALGRSYVMVGPNPNDPTKPYITPESPLQVIHEYDPIRPRWIVAAMKHWYDPLLDRVVAKVYMPDEIVSYVANKTDASGSISWEPDQWTQTGTQPNPLKEVPIIPFINRRERGGMSEFEDVIDIQDRINASVLDRMVIQAMQSYRQRWAKGVQVEDEQGNPLRPFDPGADLLWLVQDENAEFGDFEQSDLDPIIAAVHSDVTDMAAISRTPPHYLLASVANVSGDALAAAEVGLTSKVRDRLKEFGESWERTLRLAAQFANTTLPDDCSLVWADPERHTLAELADAVSKLSLAGFPFEYLARMLGEDPQTIEQLVAQRDAEQQQKQAQAEQQLQMQAKYAPKPAPGQPSAGGAKPPVKPPGKPGGGSQPKPSK